MARKASKKQDQNGQERLTPAEAEPDSPALEPESPEAEAAETARGEEVEALRAEVAELKDQLLRALAEAENLRRRSQREREEAVRYAPASLARALLPVADNLRRALESLPDDAAQDERLKALADGLALTERELQSAFERNGIERIDPLGERLDPHWHEAMFERPDTDYPNGTVCEVLEVGYRLHDRLLRPARVGVAKRAPKAEAPAAEAGKG
jgi:molecular chaperone GrpE